jgi:hypothetical protein
MSAQRDRDRAGEAGLRPRWRGLCSTCRQVLACRTTAATKARRVAPPRRAGTTRGEFCAREIEAQEVRAWRRALLLTATLSMRERASSGTC